MYITAITIDVNSFWQSVSAVAQILVAIIAFSSLYYAIWGDRKFNAPDLTIEFHEDNRSLCHKTIISPNFDTYYFRFYVENTGKSIAKHCEIVAEKLWYKLLEEQGYREYNQFAPVNLKWTGGEKGIIDINPGRKVVGNIGYIPNKDYQDYLRNRDPHPLIDLIGKEKDIKLRFIFELVQSFYALPNCLAQGVYFIQIGLYSENAKDKKLYFEIQWNGEWENEEKDMFKQIIIEKRESPP
jgi:hypothetical protein